MLAKKTSIRSFPCGSFIFALGESYAGHLVCKWGGLRPPPTPRFLKAMDACKENKSQVVATIDVCTRKQASGRFRVGHSCFALGESYAGHFVCKWGGCAPLQPALFKGHGCFQKKTRVRSSPASMFAPKNKHQVVAMWIIHVCTRGKLRGSFCLQMGGAAPPPTPPLFTGYRCLKLLHFHYFHCFRDPSLVFIIPCFCIIVEPS